MAEEVLAKIFQQVQANLKDPNSTKLSLARKREFIHTVQECIKKLEPRKIIQVQEAVMSFVFQLASTTQSGGIVSGLVGLIRFLYQNGGDFTRLLAEFFEPATAIITNQRTPPDLRLSVIIMTGKVFKTLWTRCATPPTKELFDAYTKLNVKSTDKTVRAMAYKALKNVIKVNPSNLFQIQNDLIRHLIKQLRDEKSSAVKVQMGACLNVFIQHTMNYSNIHNSFDLLFQVCLKGFEETDDMEIHRNYVLSCANLLSMRLQESQQQGDIKTGYKVYNVQLRESLNQNATKKTKNNQQGVLDVPRTFGDMISMFASMLLRLLEKTQGISSGGETSELTNQQEGIRKAICQVMCVVAEQNVVHLEATDAEQILNSMILTIPTAKEEPEESQRQRLSTVWVFQRLLKFMQEQNKVALLKLTLQTLTQKQFLIKMETLQSLTSLLPKNFKVSTMMNEAQHTALLQITQEILYSLEAKAIQANFSNEREFMDALTPYMAQPAPYSVRSSTVDVVRALASKVNVWIPSLITTLLSMVNISNADVLSLRPEAVYVVEAVTEKSARTAIIDQLRTLNINAMSLAAVFQQTKNSDSGVPVALTTASLNLAKQLVLGQLPLEVKTDQDKARYNLENINSVTNQRREAGWILLEGLLMMGQEWIMTEIVLLMKLFKTVFRKEICTILGDKMATPSYRETVFNEFMIKKRATSCLKILLTHINVASEQHKNALRQISGMICNAVNFFLNHGDKQDVDKMLLKQFGTNQTHGAKADLFACLITLPLESYQSKYVTMLHPIVEAIVHEDGGPLKIPSIYKKLLPREDLHIGPSYSQMNKSAKSKKTSEADKAPKEIEMDTRGCIWGVTDVTEYTRLLTEIRVKDFLDRDSLVPVFDSLSCFPRQNLLNNAIQLFTKIFLSDNLNNKNKNQLLKHFTVNVQPSSAPQESTKDKKASSQATSGLTADGLPYYRPEKTQKMVRIALALLSIVKSANEQDQLRIGDEQFAMILAIISSIEMSRNNFLIKIAAELTVALHSTKIVQDPGTNLEQIIAGLEQDIGAGSAPKQMTPVQEADRTTNFKRASAILGLLHRQFDYETILSPFEDRMMALMVRIFRNESLDVRKFSQHYGTMMAIEGPCSDEFYKNVFLNCFHLTQVGPSLDQMQLVNLGQLFNTFSKTANEVDNRSLVVQSEFFDRLLEHKARNENAKILMVALDTMKIRTIRNPQVLKDDKFRTKVFQATLGLIRHKTLKACVKVKAIELLAALIYRGFIYALVSESKHSLTKIVLDELNEIDDLEENMIDIKECLSSNLLFEKLVNFSNEFNLDSSGAEDEQALICPKASRKVYQECLQVLYLLIMKMNCLADFKEVTQFCKSMIAYKHTTPYTILERVFQDGQAAQPEAVGENYIFKQDFRDQTRCFVMKVFQVYTDLFYRIDTAEPGYKTMAGQLLNLGFTTVSYDSDNLKKIGFDLILTTVDILSQCIDAVKDDEDEDEDEVQSAEKKERKRIKEFIDSALLLEQYEAQIFSTIRQNMKGGASSVPSFVLERVYQLILRFITLPICKDETTISRIRDLLLENLTSDPQSIFRQNLANSESVLTSKHLQKLVLISKLIMFSHHGRDILDSEEASSSRKGDPTLPSKFGREDMTRLGDALTAGSQTKVIASHLIACLNDALVINLGKKGNIAKCKLITYGACPPQSMVGQQLNSTTKYALEALSILMAVTQGSENIQSWLEISAQNCKVVTISILQQLAIHDISGSFDSASIKKYVSGKIQELAKLKIFLENESQGQTVLRATSFELSELMDLLVSLVKLGVHEINCWVLSLIRLCLQKSFFGVFNDLMKSQKIECFVDLLNGLLLQALPEMTEEKSFDQQDSGDMTGFGAVAHGGQKQELKVAPAIAIQQTKAVLALAKEMVDYVKTNSAATNSVNIAKKVLTFTLGRLLVNSELLQAKEDAVKREVSQSCLALTEQISSSLVGTPLATEVLAPVFAASILYYSKRIDESKAKAVSTPTAFFVHSMLKQLTLSKDPEVQASARLMISDGLMSGFNSPQFNAQTLMLARDPLTGPVGMQTLVFIFSKLRAELLRSADQLDQESQEHVLYMLGCLMKTYIGVLDEPTRIAFLQPFFTVIFSSMQNTKLSPQTRNKAVEIMYSVFQADQMAFRKFAEPNPQTGQSWLTLAEKDIVGKIVQKYAAMQAQAPATATTAQANAVSAGGAKPTAAGGVKQPLATAGGNKIKLGRFGKK